MRSAPETGTIREISPKIFPQTDRSYDGTDTDHYMQPDADTTAEQLDPTPTNPAAQNIIYLIIQERVMELICGKLTYSFNRLAVFPK